MSSDGANIGAVIDDVVAGDDYELRVSVPGVPTGQGVTKAWFTAKRFQSDADPGLVQKVITAINTVGQGQILDDGTGSGGGVVGTALLRFDLQPADTALLVPSFALSPLLFDVQVLTSAGKVYTPVPGGRISASAQVTQATS